MIDNNHLQVQYITKWCYQSITAATTITTPTIMLITIIIIVFNCEPIMFITKIMFIFTTTFIAILVFNAGRPASSHGAPHKTLPLPARPTRTNLYIITIILILTISITIINVNCLSFNKFKDLAV